MSDYQATENLARLIVDKRNQLAELRKLAARQYQLVESHDFSKLMSLLAVKQQSLTQLKQIQAELAPFHEDDPDQRVWESNERRESCRKVADECASLLADVKKLEAASEAIVTQQRDEVALKVEEKTARSQAANSYLKHELATSRVSAWSVEEGD